MPRILSPLRPSKAKEETKICEDEIAAYAKASTKDDNSYAFLANELGQAYAATGNTAKACELLRLSLDRFKPTNSTDLELRRAWLTEFQRILRTCARTKEANELNDEIKQIKL